LFKIVKLEVRVVELSSSSTRSDAILYCPDKRARNVVRMSTRWRSTGYRLGRCLETDGKEYQRNMYTEE
jgi:hypothetical protein